MEDHHVDRPGVEVRQRMKLTGTNSSIGLIVLILNAHLPENAKGVSPEMIWFRSRMSGPAGLCSARVPHKRRRPVGLAKLRFGSAAKSTKKPATSKEPMVKEYSLLTIRYSLLAHPASRKHALRRPGGYGGAAAPDPIPNSAVKRSSANGTSSQDAGE